MLLTRASVAFPPKTSNPDQVCWCQWWSQPQPCQGQPRERRGAMSTKTPKANWVNTTNTQCDADKNVQKCMLLFQSSGLNRMFRYVGEIFHYFQIWFSQFSNKYNFCRITITSIKQDQKVRWIWQANSFRSPSSSSHSNSLWDRSLPRTNTVVFLIVAFCTCQLRPWKEPLPKIGPDAADFSSFHLIKYQNIAACSTYHYHFDGAIVKQWREWLGETISRQINKYGVARQTRVGLNGRLVLKH